MLFAKTFVWLLAKYLFLGAISFAGIKFGISAAKKKNAKNA